MVKLLFLKLLLEPNWEYKLSFSEDTSVDLKLTEASLVELRGFKAEADKSKLNEAKLKLLERTVNKWLKVLVEIREAIEEGSEVRLVTEFTTKLKVVKNQFRAAEDKELREKFTLKADIKLKPLEKL